MRDYLRATISETPALVHPNIHVYTAPRLGPLFDHLANRIATDPLPPFESETILLVHNIGLERWIEHQLADRHGCAAALDVVSPRTFIERIIRRNIALPRVVDDQYISDPFEQTGLTWTIHAFLSELPEDPAFDPLRFWLKRSGGTILPLAARIAQIFDDYQIYRPDLLVAWKDGDNPLSDWQPSRWQQPLWQHLCVQANVEGNTIRDRAADMFQLLNFLDQTDTRPRGVPARITLFGAQVLPEIYTRILKTLAHFVPVYWYAVQSDVDSLETYPLGRLLGDQQREFGEIVEKLDPASIGKIESEDVDEAGDSILHVIQRELQGEDVERPPFDPADASIRIHDCHSVLREMEVLKDQLLDAFENIPDLTPDEVAILVTDTQTYGPLIDAVFHSTDEDAPLKVQAARTQSLEMRTLDAFTHILGLANSRITVHAILELLEDPTIRRAAGILREEVPDLTEWVRDSRIRWGIDGEHRSTWQFPNDDAFTWKRGLDRMLLGYAVGVTDEPMLDMLPLADETLDRSELLGRFAFWIHTLLDELETLRKPRSLADWATTLADILNRFFLPEEKEEIEALGFLRSQISELDGLEPILDSTRHRVPIAEIHVFLESKSQLFEQRDQKLTGRITVTDFVRFRYAPFRVIACVGMNDGLFPRRTRLADIDARSIKPQPGDYNPRSLDKQLFLDAVLAADERLIVTFTGHSQRDNSERAPSVVVDALLDAVGTREVIVRHPLQPFSPRYFSSEDERLFSYEARQCVPPSADRSDVPPFVPSGFDIKEEATAEFLDLTVDQLADAWANPSRFFSRNLGIFLDEDDITLEEIEPLEIASGLEKYKISDLILTRLMEDDPPEKIYRYLRASDQLPPGELGRIAFDSVLNDVKEIREAILAHGEGSPLDCMREGDSWRIAGRVPRMTDGGGILYRVGDIHGRYLLRGWIMHLLLGADRPFTMIGKDGTTRFDPLSDPDAILEDLVRGYREMQGKAVPLFAKASSEYAVNPETLGKIATNFWKEDRNAYKDNDDPNVQLVFRGRDPFAENATSFTSWSNRLWSLVKEHEVKV